MPETPDDGLHAKLTEQLLGVFDSAAQTRREHYASHPESRPTHGDVDAIISSYANGNAVIAGGFSLVPGPWGLLAVIPEIVLVIRNQVKMVYDIGVAYGREDAMTRELLLGITLSASGAGSIGLLTMHGGKVLVKRPALRVFQKLVALFAGKVTQQLIKSMVAKWLPVIGAVAVAVWTRSSTIAIGRKAKEILALDIETAEGDPTRLLEDRSDEVTPEVVLAQRMVVLSNLMKVDGEASEVEVAYLNAMLNGSDLPAEARDLLRDAFVQPQQHKVDFEVFKGRDDEVLSLVMDLVALANRDGVVHRAERVYIRQVAQKVGFPADEVDAMTSGTSTA